jgi:CheY-like chemotaxis protein
MILIVDDNKKYIDRLVDLLEETGNTSRIIAANNYNEAIRIIAKEKPCIVLLDMNMPGKSGIEVLRFIKAEGWECKVIMVTNHSNESYRKLCREEGADHFLDKSRDFGLIPSLIGEMSI